MQLASFFSAAAIVVLLDGARNLCRYAKFLLEALRLVRFSVTGFFASPSKSQIKVLQSIGRGLRKSDNGKSTILYDIADDLHWKSSKNYTLLHAAERIKIYTKEQFTFNIIEIPLP